MKKDLWIDLFERSEEERKTDSLVHKLKTVDVRYQGLDSVGSGGMKEITLTEDRTTGRHIAKATLLDPENERFVEDFLREARITAHLQHPNIVPVYDLGLDENERPFFTMKLIKGHSLEAILEKIDKGEETYSEEFSLNRLIDIFIKVCEAIAYAHSERIIHLDLKPDNIQVSDFGDVAVCDWGLATLLDKEEDSEIHPNDFLFFDNRYKTLTGEIKGTPGFMAPEQTEGRKGVKDERTDVYSLGAILYQVLTKRQAIPGDNLEKIIENTQSGNITLPSVCRLDLAIPASLEAVCMKALETKPEHRYNNVQSLIDDIESYRSGFATKAEQVSVLNQLKLFYKRNKTFCLTSLVFTSIILVLTVLFIGSIRDKEKVASNALSELKEQEEINKKIGREASKAYSEKAEKAYLDFNSEAAEAWADLSLVLDPENIKALEYKGKLCFVRQDFKTAYEKLKAINNPFFDDLTEFCLKVGIEDKNPFMRVQELLPMSQSLIKTQRYALIGHLLANSVMYQPKEVRLKDLKWYLGQFNKGSQFNVKLIRRKKGMFRFDLSGNMNLINVDCLKDFPIEILDISGTSVKSINFAAKEKAFRHLRQIVLNKNQLTGKSLWWAENNCKLIYR